MPTSRWKKDEWQRHCSHEFTDLIARSDLTPTDKLDRWNEIKRSLEDLARRTIEKPTEQRVILADLDFSGVDLSGFELSRIYFARVKFDRAKLVNTSFRQSIFGERCSMAGANIQGANFWEADLKDLSLYNVTNYRLGANLNTHSEISTATNKARPDLCEAAREQRLQMDILRFTPSKLVRKWSEWTNFGSNFLPIILLFLVTNLGFGLAYYAVQEWSPSAFVPPGSYSYLDTLAMAFFRSITTNAITEPSVVWLSFVFISNGLAGLFIIGLFVAQLTKLLLRSS